MASYRPPVDASKEVVLMSTRGRGKPRPLSAALGGGELLAQRSRLTVHSASLLTADSPPVPNAAGPNHSHRVGSGTPSGDEAEIQSGSSPTEFSSILGKALSDPNALNSDELQWLAHGTFSMASKTVDYAGPAAQLCGDIVESVADEAFVQKLLELGEDGLDELMESAIAADAEAEPLSWLPFVAFLAELLVRLRSVGGSDAATFSAFCGGESATSPTRQLALLLCDCCRALLSFPSLDIGEEVECLRTALTVAGKDMEREAPEEVQALFSTMRKAFVRPALSASTCLALLELLELRASGWHLTKAQKEYYDTRASTVADVEG
ncbi:MIF4G domain-containing protein-like [Amblyomma americanum]